MSFGLRVINQDGYVQIDSKYFNLELVGKYSATLTPTYAGSGRVFGLSSISGVVNPLIVIRSNLRCAFYISRISDGNFSLYFRAVSSASSVILDYMVFDNPSGESTGYGLKVRNENGELVFDSNKKYLRVLDVISGTAITPDPIVGGITRNYPGKTVGIIVCQQAYENARVLVNPGFPPTFLQSSDTAYGSTSGSSASFIYLNDAAVTQSGGDGEYASWVYAYTYIVVDVTNY